MSRTAYDLLLEEREYLRQQMETLLGNLVKIERKAHGMPELPRERKERKMRGSIPVDIRFWIDGFQSPAMRSSLREQIQLAMAAGDQTWDDIRDAWDIPRAESA